MLKGIETSASSIAKLRSEVSACNKLLAKDYNSLCDALAALDLSTMVGDRRWVQGVTGFWDQISMAFNIALVCRDLANSREAISRIIMKINLLLTHVIGELDKEIRNQ